MKLSVLVISTLFLVSPITQASLTIALHGVYIWLVNSVVVSKDEAWAGSESSALESCTWLTSTRKRDVEGARKRLDRLWMGCVRKYGGVYICGKYVCGIREENREKWSPDDAQNVLQAVDVIFINFRGWPRG